MQVPTEQRLSFTERREAWEKVVAQVEKQFKGPLGLALARQSGPRVCVG